MSTLLCTVGTSPLVVPEAFLTRPTEYTRVRCLTSTSPQVDTGVIEAFFQDYPEVDLRIERVPELLDLADQSQQDAFEEALFRWYLKALEHGNPHVCLAGGYKSMVAALQKAAQLCGAARVFHILCDANLPAPDGSTQRRSPRDLKELDEALAQDALRAIDLGTEPGWPQIQALRAVSQGSSPLLPEIRQRLEEINRRAVAWDTQHGLPFPSLALWPRADRDWLDSPLSADDLPWLRQLPKVELHCHLGGWATDGDALRCIRAKARFPQQLPALQTLPTPSGWPCPEAPLHEKTSEALQAYMRLGDNNGSALLRDPGCLDAQVDFIYQSLQEDCICYAEIRCSPNNYVWADGPEGAHRSAWEVLQAIQNRFQKNIDATPLERRCLVNLIIIATRRPDGDHHTAIARHLALAITAAQHAHHLPPEASRVAGVDLAGFEDRETRAAYFRTDFEPVHRCGLAVTCHAGENDDAEGIWQAVLHLNARRIGHGLRLKDSPELSRLMADRRIAVEMCPAANLQIRGYQPMPGLPAYPLLQYLKEGLPVTVNTDNPGISAASLSDNYALLVKLCLGITRLQCLQLLRNAAEATFLHATQREALLAHIDRSLPPPQRSIR